MFAWPSHNCLLLRTFHMWSNVLLSISSRCSHEQTIWSKRLVMREMMWRHSNRFTFDWKSLWIILIWRNLENVHRIYWRRRKLCEQIGLHKGLWISREARLLLLASQVGKFCQICSSHSGVAEDRCCWRLKFPVILPWSTLRNVPGDSNYYLLYLLSFFSVFHFSVEYRRNINKFYI